MLLAEGFCDLLVFEEASSAVKNTDVSACMGNVVTAVPIAMTTLDCRPVIPVPRGAYRRIIVSRFSSLSILLHHCFCNFLSNLDAYTPSVAQ